MLKIKIIRLLLLFITCLFVFTAAGMLFAKQIYGQTTEEVEYTWSAPTTGSSPVYYVVEDSLSTRPTWEEVAQVSSESYIATIPYLSEYRIRVTGVDIENRVGITSLSSDPYTPDPGAPGKPSKPIRIF